jgi:urate oxidase
MPSRKRLKKGDPSMPVVMTRHAYGKSQVRLTHVTRHDDRHELKELTIGIQLEGDFAASYVSGDNRNVIATDCMKNTVYVLAKKHGIGAIEGFGETLAHHFVQTYKQVGAATIDVVEHPWRRLVVGGREHPHAFIGGINEKRTAVVTCTGQSLLVESGVSDLSLLKTTDSAFAGFIRDEYTTLRETKDRIFATLLCARWRHAKPPADWDQVHHLIRQALVETFAGHQSLSVQQTLHATGQAALAACPEISDITLTMPNKHHLLVDLKPFGLENQNEIFVPTDEPHGVITATLSRIAPG